MVSGAWLRGSLTKPQLFLGEACEDCRINFTDALALVSKFFSFPKWA